MLEHLELSGLRLVVFLLELLDVGRGALKLDLQLLLAGLHTVMMGFPKVSLVFHVDFLCQRRVQLEDCAFQLYDGLLALPKAQLKVIDLGFIRTPLLLHQRLMLALQASHVVSQSLAQSFHIVGQLSLKGSHIVG